MKKLMIASLALVLCVVGYVAASSTGQINGTVNSVTTTLGPGGLTNTIAIEINSLDGLTWTAMCRRAYSNLGLCQGVSQGNLVLTSGWFSSNSTLELEYLQNKGTVSPP